MLFFPQGGGITPVVYVGVPGGSPTSLPAVACFGRQGNRTPAHQLSSHLRGATSMLLSPDGRAAVVRCESRLAQRMAGHAGDHRDCPDASGGQPSSRVIWPSWNGSSAWMARRCSLRPASCWPANSHPPAGIVAPVSAFSIERRALA